MPRYFLNIRDDDVLIADPDGDELPTLEDARQLVHAIIRDILVRPETYGSARRWTPRVFEITDETGAVLATLPFPSV